MHRTILRANGDIDTQDVGNSFETWNKAIGASIGQIVCSPDRSLELWCDEEGLLVEEPKVNLKASILACQQIVGDVIVFHRGDIK